jgi:hypothetical protein
MASSPSNFNVAGDLEKGHRLAIDTNLPQASSPALSPSNDPLSPTFGATRSPVMNGGHATSMHDLHNVAIPTLSLDEQAPEVRPTPTSAGSEDSTTTRVNSLPQLSYQAEEKIAIPEKALVKVDQTLTAIELQKAEIKHVETAKPANTATPQSGPVATRWVKFLLFFNTYRYVNCESFNTTILTLVLDCRKFFTVVVTFNGVCIVLAALGRFPYAENNNGAFILGNLLMAVMMRNELFLRGVFWVVNTCLAKVRGEGLSSRPRTKNTSS